MNLNDSRRGPSKPSLGEPVDEQRRARVHARDDLVDHGRDLGLVEVLRVLDRVRLPVAKATNLTNSALFNPMESSMSAMSNSDSK